MRKLILQVQVTVDGFIAGPSGEMDWMLFNWDDELKDYVTQLTNSIDTIVLGRKLAEGFIPHWAAVAADPTNPDVLAGKKFTEMPKVVFTNTPAPSGWENTVVNNGNLCAGIRALKSGEGDYIMAYGGARFVSNLIAERLIDEFHLFVNPVAIGSGLSIFKNLAQKQPLQLLKATAFSCGIVVLHYKLS